MSAASLLRAALLALSLPCASAAPQVATPQVAAAPVAEDEAAPGEGRDLFVARCSSCHSVDYVRMHAPFGTRALWEAEVAKMRSAFKAPLDDAEARAIVDHLVEAYGPGSPAAQVAAGQAPSAHDRQ